MKTQKEQMIVVHRTKAWFQHPKVTFLDETGNEILSISGEYVTQPYQGEIKILPKIDIFEFVD